MRPRRCTQGRTRTSGRNGNRPGGYSRSWTLSLLMLTAVSAFTSITQQPAGDYTSVPVREPDLYTGE